MRGGRKPDALSGPRLAFLVAPDPMGIVRLPLIGGDSLGRSSSLAGSLGSKPRRPPARNRRTSTPASTEGEHMRTRKAKFSLQIRGLEYDLQCAPRPTLSPVPLTPPPPARNTFRGGRLPSSLTHFRFSISNITPICPGVISPLWIVLSILAISCPPPPPRAPPSSPA